MNVALPLDEMTLAEKLRAFESLWDDLCRTPGSVESPAWHGDVLREREAALRDGREEVMDWEEAKKKICESLP